MITFWKSLLLVGIFQLCSSKLALPKFTLKSDRGGVPLVSVRFPDGYEDNLILKKFFSNRYIEMKLFVSNKRMFILKL